LDIECWAGDHLLWAVVAGVALFLWGFGLPFAAFRLLKGNKNNLKDV